LTRIGVRVESWPAKRPFRITGREFLAFDVIVVEIERGGEIGRGEGMPVFYLGESCDSLVAQVEGVAGRVVDVEHLGLLGQRGIEAEVFRPGSPGGLKPLQGGKQAWCGGEEPCEGECPFGVVGVRLVPEGDARQRDASVVGDVVDVVAAVFVATVVEGSGGRSWILLVHGDSPASFRGRAHRGLTGMRERAAVAGRGKAEK